MFGLLIAIIYICFISLGLPDSLLGAAWPSMYGGLGVPVSYAGIISVVIAAGTVVSSLLSDLLTKKLGTGAVTGISVAMTAGALFGFSVSNAFWMLAVFAVPYGLGAGGVDAALNNYVALHLKSRHMSWLHCMWGVGAAIGPYIMGYALSGGYGWSRGYLVISIIQIALTAAVFCSLPLWKRGGKPSESGGETGEKGSEPAEKKKPLTPKEIVRIRGAVPCFITFFCYCALESTAILWSSSYMVLNNGISADTAATLAGLFLIGITVGRAVNGFLTLKFSDKTLIRVGECVILAGVVMLFLPFGNVCAIIGLVLLGLGCAPVYPSIIHMTPELFGADKSQAVIGVQMASAYIGTCTMPPLFGFLANNIGAWLFPVFLGIWLCVMAVMHEVVVKKTANAVIR